jgi:carbohydrate kinase (thermoresistant glucokinase family)
MVIILMGVAGSGKSTVGPMLARALGGDFHDADHLHPPADRDKMRRGIPLTDDDRRPWLVSVRTRIDRYENAVVARSALMEAYRRAILLVGGKDVLNLSEGFGRVDHAALGPATRPFLRPGALAEPV